MPRPRLAPVALVLTLLTALVAAQPRPRPTPEGPPKTDWSIPARIKIDVDRTVGEVDPHLFGNFAEHLGRMIYGGIYEPGSPLSDADGYRKDVMDAVKALHVTILRWPGGNFASGYDWKDGIGPKAMRPVRPELAWNDVESNQFGTDEFLKYTERIGADPYICLNLGLGTIGEARDWVEYTNGTLPTYWADQRRKNGRQEPWKVRYWALGNEIDGPWQLGHKNAEEYAKFALETAKAMRAVDPEIRARGQRVEQLRAERRLDRVEPHRAPDARQRGGLHRAAHLHRRPRGRFRALHGVFAADRSGTST